MPKLSQLVDDCWELLYQPRVFEYERSPDGTQRILAGFEAAHRPALDALLSICPESWYVLYVLHTSRGEAETGRYESTLLRLDEVVKFLDEYWGFLGMDSRYDLWFLSPDTGATIVWDRHDHLWLYGPLADFESVLLRHGYERGTPFYPSPHMHQFHWELDVDAAALLAEFDWYRTPLKEADVQFPDP
jgi:hypothetical protein